jgi:catechol 2,3-dioxygenase-like lactoylglutathione lyase family enzyme
MASATTLKSLTPNLVVSDIDASTAFYRDVLGFAVKQTVPDTPPFAFVWLERGAVQVFLNDLAAVRKEPPVAARNIGGSGMYIVVEGLDELHEAVSRRTSLVMPLTRQFYGMREFAVTDPDGHLITFAQPYEQ